MPLIKLKHCSLEVLPIAAPDEDLSAFAHAQALAPLVFLHEGLGSVDMWRTKSGYWPEDLCRATGRAGIVYSRRGYGRSQDIQDVRGAHRLPADYMHHEAWEVLPELLALLGVERPVLVGHSDGGTIALLHAARFDVEACVVMAPHVMVEEVSIRSIEQAREAFIQGDLRARLAKYHDHVDTAFWQWNDVWLSEAFASFDIRDLCKKITQPVLAIQGVQDAYGTLRQIEEIEPAGDIQRLKVEQCGHSLFRDAHQLIIDNIARFLNAR